MKDLPESLGTMYVPKKKSHVYLPIWFGFPSNEYADRKRAGEGGGRGWGESN